MNRLGYFARETLVSLRRNLMMTFAGVLTVMVSLFLAGVMLLIQQAVNYGTEKWREGVEFEIFMVTDASPGQIEDVRDDLKAMQDEGSVEDFTYLDKQAAYKEAQRLFKDRPEVLEAISPEVLPVSFRVAPVDAALTEQLAARFDARVGVEEVITADKQIKAMLAVTNTLQWFFLAVVTLLLVASLFLIVNTIRLATYARRREIEVMKLVGASNLFVRVPFMLEGLVQGLLGSAVAISFVWGVKVILNDKFRESSNLLNTFYITDGNLQWIIAFLLVIGAATGLAASMIGLRRFLDA